MKNGLFRLEQRFVLFSIFWFLLFCNKRLCSRQKPLVFFSLVQCQHGLDDVLPKQVGVLLGGTIHKPFFEMLQHLLAVGLVRRCNLSNVLNALSRSDELFILGVNE